MKSAVSLCLFIIGFHALANDDQVETETRHWEHGISLFGEFKYPPGFEHFEYVNIDLTLIHQYQEYDFFDQILILFFPQKTGS